MLFNKNGNAVNDNEEISAEASAYIMEAVMSDLGDEDLSMFLENQTEIDAALAESVLLERTIVRLDKKAKLSKARKMATFTIAKEKNDPKFKKLLMIWKMERYLEAFLDKKYGNEAMRRAKKTVAANNNSKSSMVKKAINKAKAQLNSANVKVPPKPEEVRMSVPKNVK